MYNVRIKCVSVCDKAGNYGVWDSKRERKNQVLMKIVLAKSSGKICVLSTFKHRFTSECWMQILEIVMVHYVVDAVLILPYFSFHIYFSFSHLTSINIIISIHHSFFSSSKSSSFSERSFNLNRSVLFQLCFFTSNFFLKKYIERIEEEWAAVKKMRSEMNEKKVVEKRDVHLFEVKWMQFVP